MQLNKIIRLTVGADLSRTPPIYRPCVDVPIPGLFCENSLSALRGRSDTRIHLFNFIIRHGFSQGISTHKFCLFCFAHLESLDDEHYPSNKRPASGEKLAQWAQRIQDDQKQSKAYFEVVLAST